MKIEEKYLEFWKKFIEKYPQLELEFFPEESIEDLDDPNFSLAYKTKCNTYAIVVKKFKSKRFYQVFAYETIRASDRWEEDDVSEVTLYSGIATMAALKSIWFAEMRSIWEDIVMLKIAKLFVQLKV